MDADFRQDIFRTSFSQSPQTTTPPYIILHVRQTPISPHPPQKSRFQLRNIVGRHGQAQAPNSGRKNEDGERGKEQGTLYPFKFLVEHFPHRARETLNKNFPPPSLHEQESPPFSLLPSFFTSCALRASKGLSLLSLSLSPIDPSARYHLAPCRRIGDFGIFHRCGIHTHRERERRLWMEKIASTDDVPSSSSSSVNNDKWEITITPVCMILPPAGKTAAAERGRNLHDNEQTSRSRAHTTLRPSFLLLLVLTC